MMDTVSNLKSKNSVYQKTPLRKLNASPRAGEDILKTCNKKGVMSWIYKELPHRVSAFWLRSSEELPQTKKSLQEA